MGFISDTEYSPPDTVERLIVNSADTYFAIMDEVVGSESTFDMTVDEGVRCVATFSDGTVIVVSDYDDTGEETVEAPAHEDGYITVTLAFDTQDAVAYPIRGDIGNYVIAGSGVGRTFVEQFDSNHYDWISEQYEWGISGGAARFYSDYNQDEFNVAWNQSYEPGVTLKSRINELTLFLSWSGYATEEWGSEEAYLMLGNVFSGGLAIMLAGSVPYWLPSQNFSYLGPGQFQVDLANLPHAGVYFSSLQLWASASGGG